MGESERVILETTERMQKNTCIYNYIANLIGSYDQENQRFSDVDNSFKALDPPVMYDL